MFKRLKHRNSPNVESSPAPFRIDNQTGKVIKEQRNIGKHFLHPTKGWRKVTPRNMSSFHNKVVNFINRMHLA